MAEKKINIIREGWRIARPYWFSEERWIARGLLVAVIAMLLFQVWINVRLNFWRNDFYNSLQNYDSAEFFRLIGIFTLYAFAAVLLGVYQVYLQQMLQIRWRRWMTNSYLQNWLQN
jgi:putative ATP-binding cassette transporter